MRNKNTRCFSFLLACLLICSLGNTAQAADQKTEKGTRDTITKEVLFSSEDKKASKKEAFQETIKENGKTYRLKNVEYKQLDRSPVTIKKEISKEVKSDPIPEGQEYQPPETLEDGGVTYQLEKVDKKEQETGNAETQTVTGHTDFDRAVTRSDVPATKQVTVKNNRTGEDMTVNCDLKDVTAITNASWEDTHIDIVFESYDSQIFQWNGVTVTKDTQTPLAGYESQLLASVGADSSNYRVLRTYWKGEPYTDANGTVCRDARADAQRLVNYYRANYAAAVPLEGTKATIYTATYKGTEKITDDSQYVYTIKATGMYQVQDTNYAPFVLAGIGIALLLLLTVLILMLLMKKKKEKEEN